MEAPRPPSADWLDLLAGALTARLDELIAHAAPGGPRDDAVRDRAALAHRPPTVCAILRGEDACAALADALASG